MASGMNDSLDSLDSLYRKMCYLRSHAQEMHHRVTWPLSAYLGFIRQILLIKNYVNGQQPYQNFSVGGGSMHGPSSPT